MNEIEIVTLDEDDLEKIQMFCGHSPTYRGGYRAKIEWMRQRLQEGMHYTLLRVNHHNAGLIEYIPGEYAWRGVDAAGYLFIHCFWVIGSHRKHGYGQQLLHTCLEDARGTNGVAVVVSKAHWLPTPKIFIKNGFEKVDHVDPSFDLLIRRMNSTAPVPRFTQESSPIPPGLTLYKSDQCPYTQNAAAIVEKVGEQLKVPVNIIHVNSARSARQIPCPYGTLAYAYNGEFLTYHPAGSEELLQMLKQKQGGG